MAKKKHTKKLPELNHKEVARLLTSAVDAQEKAWDAQRDIELYLNRDIDNLETAIQDYAVAGAGRIDEPIALEFLKYTARIEKWTELEPDPKTAHFHEGSQVPCYCPNADERAHTGQTYDLRAIDAAEVTFILAAARYFQGQFRNVELRAAAMPEHFAENEPLTDSQIDALCEYINLEA